MDVTMLLCDAASESGGKLYVLGGGWSAIQRPRVPVPMALAVKLAIPWDQTNKQQELRAVLIDDDANPVTPIGAEEPLVAEGQIEAGRPAGLKPGSAIDMPFVLNFGPVTLEPGGYVWELQIDEKPVARVAFRVMGV